MRDIPLALQAHLDGGATTTAMCWRLELANGVVRGFTEHDRDLAFGGLTYRAATGFTGTAIETQTGLAVSDQTVAGVLSDDGIIAAELEAGLYDGAAVETWLVNWTDSAQRLLLMKSEIGEVKRGAHAFEAELRGLAAKLNLPVGRSYQPVCDAVLGDARCGVALTATVFNGTGAVTASTDRRVLTVSGLDAFAADWFAGGSLLWLTGANHGLRAEVRASSSSSIELWREAPLALATGDTFKVTAGCDKTFATCRARFDNAGNFRGFPTMPGNDWIAAYPVTGDRHDGGSLTS